MMLRKLDRHMQKNETRPPTYTKDRNKVTMDKGLKCKIGNHKKY